MKYKLTLPEKLKDLRALAKYYHVSAVYLPGITSLHLLYIYKKDTPFLECPLPFFYVR